jgi:hypothetical protein
MSDINKTKLEDLLKRMIKDGADLSSYRRGPTKLLVPPSLLMAAQKIYQEQDTKKYEIEVDFNE